MRWNGLESLTTNESKEYVGEQGHRGCEGVSVSRSVNK